MSFPMQLSSLALRFGNYKSRSRCEHAKVHCIGVILFPLARSRIYSLVISDTSQGGPPMCVWVSPSAALTPQHLLPPQPVPALVPAFGIFAQEVPSGIIIEAMANHANCEGPCPCQGSPANCQPWGHQDRARFPTEAGLPNGCEWAPLWTFDPFQNLRL